MKRHGSLPWQMYLIFTFVLKISIVSGTTYYCEDYHVEIYDQSGTIQTRREGSTYYDNDMKCTWVIQGMEPTDNVYIKVTSSDLAWAPETAICNGYDFVEVRTGFPKEDYFSDGYDQGDYYSQYDENILVSWCGKRNPVSVVTDTNMAVITFITNDRNSGNYKFAGVTLDFMIVSRPLPYGGCPPGWFMGPNPNTGPHCYGLQKHDQTWKKAQEFCSYNSANLVSLQTESEADFVSNLIAREYKGRHKVWLGLNDISKDTAYQWIERSALNITPRWADSPTHKSNEFLNCIYLMSHNGLWKEESCAESDVVSLVKNPFLCKKNASGNTTMYIVPDERTEKGDEGKLPPKALIITGIIVGCLVVLGTFGAIYWKFYRTKGPQNTRAPSNDGMNLENQATENNPPQYSPPPSYHEVADLPYKSAPPEEFL